MKENFPDTKSLIQSCLDKNEDAFRILVDRYAEFSYSVAFRLINDDEEAKDIVQETFITIWHKLKSFNVNKNFETWLFRIITNKCFDYLRKKKRVSFIYPDENNWNIPDLFDDSNAELKLSNKETGKIIRVLTQKLSMKQKVVFILSELEGFSRDSVAEITGMSKNSVKSNLNHARRNIGTMLEKYIQ